MSMSPKKILVAGALAAMMVVPTLPALAVYATPTSADYSTYSVEQLEALIGKLQKQLEDLKKQSKCFVSDADLSLGDGEDESSAEGVRRLQGFLSEKGLFKYKSTGYFGKMTRNSVVAFQRANKLPESGAFDAATRAKAHAMYCKKLVRTTEKQVKKEMPTEKPAPVVSDKVRSINATAAGNHVTWSVDGYSVNGFKIVWSKNQNPTYPTREGDKYIFASDPESRAADLDMFDGPGTYYVRVCEYVGGCGKYSNEIVTQLAQ